MTYAVDTLNADMLIQMDADMSHDPTVLPQFIEKLQSGYDFAVGSRYIKGVLYQRIGGSIEKFIAS